MTRTGLLLSSHSMRILRGQRALLTARPMDVALRVDCINITTHRDAWLVHDIKVGHHSQFAPGSRHAARREHLPIDGSEFHAGLPWQLAACQTAQDISLEIEYVGDDPDGEPFVAEATGEVVA